MRTILLVVAGLLLPLAAFATQWKNGISSTGTRYALIEDADGEHLPAQLYIGRNTQGEYLAALDFAGHLLDCRDGTCQVQTRFDDGPPGQLITSVAPSGDMLLVFNTKAFVRALEYARSVSFEVPLQSVGLRRYRFDVAGLPLRTEPDKPLPILRTPFGSSRSVALSGAEPAVHPAATAGDCYTVPVGSVLSADLGGTALACFVKDRLAQIRLDVPFEQASALAELENSLTRAFGAPREDRLGRFWPNVHNRAVYKQTYVRALVSESPGMSTVKLIDRSLYDLIAGDD